MNRPNLLTEEEINFRIEDLHLWKREGNQIIRETVAANFAAAVGIINSIAIISEAMDHHPDIQLYGWNKLRITLSTHDKGGLTKLDFELAKKIDDLTY
ncbi:MAG: 4a-hydroxytetrahydrobiopterin dehydratase [Candidatus Kapaibacterium sp.]|jgi:4a-hydroxytetrahydrobiopterin dehydratase|nr:4a-hydroxytetrahydrobiopterin dehydratase [Candidatus Kapabacteria bacterium]